MSGYGRGVAEDEGLQISFELRSVNHRFFRLGLHLPARLAFFETTARQLITERVQRGKVDLTGTIRGPSSLSDVQIDQELAASYAESFTVLAGDLGIEPEIDLAMLADLPGVVSRQSTRPLGPQGDKARAKEALSEALDEFEAMRTAEDLHLPVGLEHHAPGGESAVGVDAVGLTGLCCLDEDLPCREHQLEASAHASDLARVSQTAHDL